MDGIATALVGFILVCIIYPHLIKNRHQYYMALAAMVLILLLRCASSMFPFVGFINFVSAFSYLLEAAALLLLVMAAGGLTPQQLAGDMARAYEVMRRGEDEKTVIIPIPGQQPGSRKAAGPDPEEERKVYTINEPPAPPKSDSGGSIPLE